MMQVDGSDPAFIEQEAPERTALVVLGMHRSGTSMLARTLNLLGADLPRDLMGPSEHNFAGFWEPNDLVGIHEEMLAAAGATWHSVDGLHPVWEDRPLMALFYDRIVKSIDMNYAGSRFFVLKDPRISRFVPLIVQALRDVGATPKFIIAIRNPLEVAASLSKRDAFHENKSLLLWLDHLLAAERDTRGFSRSFVFYEDMLEDWRSQLRKVARELRIEFAGWNSAAEGAVESSIEFGLHHHVRSLDEILSGDDGLPWVRSALQAFIGLSRETGNDSLRVLDAVSLDYSAAQNAFGPILSQMGAEIAEVSGKAKESASAAQDAINERDRLRTELAAAEKRTDDLAAAPAHLEDELAKASDRLAQTEAERRGYEAEVANLIAKLSDLEARFVQTQDVSNDRFEEIRDKDLRLASQAAAISSLQAEVAQGSEIVGNIHRSNSWRVTAPLRWISRIAVGLSFRGRR